MKLSVTQQGDILIKEVFNPIILQSASGEVMSICMRDSGFEFTYQGQHYFAKEGYVEPFKTSIRGNFLVEQRHESSTDCLPNSDGASTF